MIGFVLTMLLTTLISVLVNRPATLEKLVRQRTSELHDSRERFELAASAAKIGVWDRDAVNNRLVWDDRMYQLYGIRPEEFDGKDKTWEKYIHPADLSKLYRDIELATAENKDFDCEFRIIRPDNEVRYIKTFGKVIRSEKGTPVRMIGVNYDITEQKQAEKRINSQLDELNRWYQVTLGRENRALELKKEINEILYRNGKPPRYKETADLPPDGL